MTSESDLGDSDLEHRLRTMYTDVARTTTVTPRALDIDHARRPHRSVTVAAIAMVVVAIGVVAFLRPSGEPATGSGTGNELVWVPSHMSYLYGVAWKAIERGSSDGHPTITFIYEGGNTQIRITSAVGTLNDSIDGPPEPVVTVATGLIPGATGEPISVNGTRIVESLTPLPVATLDYLTTRSGFADLRYLKSFQNVTLDGELKLTYSRAGSLQSGLQYTYHLGGKVPGGMGMSGSPERAMVIGNETDRGRFSLLAFGPEAVTLTVDGKPVETKRLTDPAGQNVAVAVIEATHARHIVGVLDANGVEISHNTVEPVVEENP